MKNILTLIVVLFSAHLSMAQCSVVITTPTPSIECGDCATLTAVGTSTSTPLSADFNGSSLGPGWNSNVTVLYTNPCGPPPDGSLAAWFGLGSQPREMQTIDFDVSCGGDVCFEMKYATQSGSGNCEGPDAANEGVHFQYSLNGGVTWVDIQYWPPNGGYDPNLTVWNLYCVTIPTVAQTVSTRFRWYQDLGSGATFDHWGIDNVELSVTACDAYYYDWGVDGITNAADTNICMDTSSEDFTVIFTNGIDDTCSATITMNSSISVDLGPDTILNCGQSTVDLMAVQSGSSAGYDVLWSTGATATYTQNNVSAGNYWVEVTDQGFPNCIGSDTISITQPANPIADFNFTSVCEGFDFTFSDNTTLGDGPLVQHDWDTDGDGVQDSTGSSFTMNYDNGGIYQVTYTVVDNKGCTDDITKPVQMFYGPVVDFTFDPICSGYATDFTNQTTPPVGSNNDTWYWDFIGQGATSTLENPTHLYANPGIYDVYLEATSDDGCVGDTTLQVEIKQTPQADFTYYAPCEGEEITFTNTSSGNYVNSQWLFLNGSQTINSQDAAFTFPTGSNMDVTLIIEDAIENCSDTVTITVVEIPKLTVQVVNQVDVTCNSGNDGIAAVNVTQGTPPYSYSWTGSVSTNPIATDLAFGTTTVTVTDANGCVVTEDIFIDQPDPLTIIDISKDTIICIGDPVNLFAQGSGGSSPYTYTWVANNVTVANGSNVNVTPSAGITEYCLILGEQCGSPQDTACVVVSYPGEVDPILTPDKTGECFPIEVNFTNSTNTTETIDYTIWTYSDGEIDTTAGLNPTTHEFGLGIYDVDMEIVSDRGCRYFKSYDKLIEGYPYPEADFYISPNPVSLYEAKVGAYSQSGSDIVSYEWFADGAIPSYSSVQNPKFQYPNEINNYPMILVVENEYGCKDTLQKIVRVENVVTIFAPNTFTPDSDGFNDTWRVHILGIDTQNFHLQIYNRWGEKVFESFDPNGEWDGTYGGKIVKEGSYMWTIKAYNFDDDNKHEFNGAINVLR